MKVETVTLKSGNGYFLSQKYTEKYQPEHTYTFHIKCNVKTCKYTANVEVKSEDLYKYHQGKYIQDAFPYISQTMRGLMLDGICHKCWDKMFPEDIDEELHLQE